jgi:hypothetical protein
VNDSLLAPLPSSPPPSGPGIRPRAPPGDLPGGGGGAIAILWPLGVPAGTWATLYDIVAVNNTVAISEFDQVYYPVLMGGGALFLSGGANSSRVSITHCTFSNNTVTGSGQSVYPCGGGACLLLGMQPEEVVYGGWPLGFLALDMAHVDLSGNVLDVQSSERADAGGG